MGITQYRIAKAIDEPARRINEIVHGKPPLLSSPSAWSFLRKPAALNWLSQNPLR
jgi:hypothetical protein